GAVVVLLQANEHAWIAAARAEPAAGLIIPEQLVLPLLQRNRPLKPDRIDVRLKQLEQPEDQTGIVLGVRLDLRPLVAKAPQQRARPGTPHPLAQARRRPLRRFEVRRAGSAVRRAGPQRPCQSRKRRE